jgi:hypothetical protein
MNPKYSKTEVLDIIGILDRDSNGKYIITIEQKDDTIIKDFDEIIEKSLGEMISFKVVTEIDD